MVINVDNDQYRDMSIFCKREPGRAAHRARCNRSGHFCVDVVKPVVERRDDRRPGTETPKERGGKQ